MGVYYYDDEICDDGPVNLENEHHITVNIVKTNDAYLMFVREDPIPFIFTAGDGAKDLATNYSEWVRGNKKEDDEDEDEGEDSDREFDAREDLLLEDPTEAMKQFGKWLKKEKGIANTTN